jgi:hypothetical protein
VHEQQIGAQSLAPAHAAPVAPVPVTMVGAVGHAPFSCSESLVVPLLELELEQPTAINNEKMSVEAMPLFMKSL